MIDYRIWSIFLWKCPDKNEIIAFLFKKYGGYCRPDNIDKNIFNTGLKNVEYTDTSKNSRKTSVWWKFAPFPTILNSMKLLDMA